MGRKKETERRESKNESRPTEEKPIQENLIIFDLLVKEAGLDPKALDIFGEHNWHKNLMSVLSIGLAKMMSREQAFAVINAKLPNYSQETVLLSEYAIHQIHSLFFLFVHHFGINLSHSDVAMSQQFRHRVQVSAK